MAEDEADALAAAREVTATKSVPPIEDAFEVATVSVPRNAWLSAVAVACFYRAEHEKGSVRDAIAHLAETLRHVTPEGATSGR